MIPIPPNLVISSGHVVIGPSGDLRFVVNMYRVPLLPDKLLGQAASQLEAANGAQITWSFAEQGAANTVRSLFQKQGIKGINIIYTAPK